jgi:hypothetical protein
VRAPPTCKLPVGEGANRKRGGASLGFLPANGKTVDFVVAWDSSVVEKTRTAPCRKATLEDLVTNACDGGSGDKMSCARSL